MATLDNSTKAALLKLLKQGEVTFSEAARLAGTTKQTARNLAQAAGLDVAAARERYLDSAWRSALRSAPRGLRGVRKAD